MSYQAAATTAYVRPSMPNTSTSYAPLRASNPTEPSNAADTGAGRAGSVMSTTRTPWSATTAMAAYVRPSMPNTSTSYAPPKAFDPSEPPNAADTGAGRAGSVTLIICTPWSASAATTA